MYNDYCWCVLIDRCRITRREAPTYADSRSLRVVGTHAHTPASWAHSETNTGVILCKLPRNGAHKAPQTATRPQNFASKLCTRNGEYANVMRRLGGRTAASLMFYACHVRMRVMLRHAPCSGALHSKQLDARGERRFRFKKTLL